MRELIFGIGFVVLFLFVAILILKQSDVIEKSYIKILPELYQECLTQKQNHNLLW